ncbi:hypothetical protein [Spiroplasma endosymbiont of Phyllotreta cruciferae]|uniref:hypothetical protein n=1 Tax=Spiroplasma endosymbiont of Phyllotreta cruciferae TaxID=2886375 RepID=UPI0020A18C53|nr:hypothetical protein [Spiroplasma endosymbiont of Phyllotreta cruciferae]
MGKNYHCADNIVIESFHSLLKKATIHNKIYNSHEEYIQDVIKWNTWYSNRKEKDIIKKIVNTFYWYLLNWVHSSFTLSLKVKWWNIFNFIFIDSFRF